MNKPLKRIGLLLVIAAIALFLGSLLIPKTKNTPNEESAPLAQNDRPRQFFGGITAQDADSAAQSFAQVTQDKPLTLPTDNKSHPDYQLEWWYLTFVLEDDNKNEYGLQYTLFRFKPPGSSEVAESNWANTQQWMGHASLHTKTQHYFEERFAAGGVGNAYVNGSSFEAIIDDWSWRSSSSSNNHAMFPSSLNLSLKSKNTTGNSSPSPDQALALGESVSIDLSLDTSGPFVKQGDNGYSRKTQDERLRSYYYSQPFINAKGNLLINGKSIGVKGLGWFDHEWTSHLANSEAMGWDWFSIHLDDGNKVMAFRMHSEKVAQGKEQSQNEDMQQRLDQEGLDESHATYITGTFISKEGETTTLDNAQLTLTPTHYETIMTRRGVRTMPTSWRIAIPSKALDVTVTPFKDHQWNDGFMSYYEGRVTVSGSHTGRGYMELTGY